MKVAKSRGASRIESATFTDADGKPVTLQARVFIDGSYEGDLLAKAARTYPSWVRLGNFSAALNEELTPGRSVTHPMYLMLLDGSALAPLRIAPGLGPTCRLSLTTTFSAGQPMTRMPFERVVFFTMVTRLMGKMPGNFQAAENLCAG